MREVGSLDLYWTINIKEEQMSRIVLLVALLFVLFLATPSGYCDDSPLERRSALIELARDEGAKAIPRLGVALRDDNPFVRRTALRLLGELGEPALPVIKDALSNSDEMVRRNALVALADLLQPDEFTKYLGMAIRDESENVRLAAVHFLTVDGAPTGERLELLRLLSRDKNQSIRDIAARMTWPFSRNKIRLRDRKDWDYDVNVTASHPLPVAGWKIAKDKDNTGHLEKWYEVEFDDSKWIACEIEKAWESFIGPYDGVGWYRLKFRAPERPAKFNAVELSFKGVDEEAWVWMNGTYLGEHALGIKGYDVPFALDITDEIKWGEENQLTVRVNDALYAGGIHRGIAIDILE